MEGHPMRQWKSGDRVHIKYGSQLASGVVSAASPNGRSLVLQFEGMLGCYCGAMPVLEVDGKYLDLLCHEVAELAEAPPVLEMSVMICVKLSELEAQGGPLLAITKQACMACGAAVGMTEAHLRAAEKLGAKPICVECATELADRLPPWNGVSEEQEREVALGLRKMFGDRMPRA